MCSLVNVLSKEERKKRSLETGLWMSIWGCSTPASYCQPAVAAGFIYANLRSEFNTHLAHSLCLFRVLLGMGKVALHLPSPASMFIYSSRGKWSFPPLLWSILPTDAFTGFPALGCWVGATPAFFGQLVYLAFHGVLPLPPFLALRVPHPLSMCLFCCCLLFSLSFYPGWGLVCPGGYADLAQDCLWECHIPLSSPCVLHLPKQSGRWHLVVQEPSWMWSGNATWGLGVWWSQCFASSLWFFL
jgi:hypothetical protein